MCLNTGCVNLLECVIEMKKLIKIWKCESWKVNPKVAVYYHSLSQTLSEHTDFINMSFLSEAWAHPGCVCHCSFCCVSVMLETAPWPLLTSLMHAH